MADDADRADQETNSAIDEARWKVAQQAKYAPALLSNGQCHYCRETVVGGLLFCEPACAEDFAEEECQLKRMGRR